MIFGNYPCCGGDLHLSMPDNSPQYMPEDCPHCGAKVWHKLSRIQSTSWTEADFLELYEVDEKAKTLTERNPPDPAMVALLDEMMKPHVEEMAKRLENMLLYGTDK